MLVLEVSGISGGSPGGGGASFGGVFSAGGGIAFEFREQAEVVSVRPTQGHALGGDWIDLIGSGFGNGPEKACRFGLNAPVPAIWYSASHVSCRSPPRHPGNVTLEFASDGRAFTASGASFSYVEAMLVSVLPSYGPVGGGTVVTMDGVSMPDDLGVEVWCSFAVTKARATRLNATSLTCTSP
ncbi:hypothetical protein T484DRAFT_1912311 [Baffinella frigidus]|nr:hypothetical protein T484DRAFT_1912311 [Cryptophyta sp. CCMP2293]